MDAKRLKPGLSLQVSASLARPGDPERAGPQFEVPGAFVKSRPRDRRAFDFVFVVHPEKFDEGIVEAEADVLGSLSGVAAAIGFDQIQR